MDFLTKFILFAIFLSIGFNFSVVEGLLYLSNILSLIISILIILNLNSKQLYNEKNQFITLLGLIFLVTINMQSISAFKWVYLFLTFCTYSLFLKYYKPNLNHILIIYTLGIVCATLFSFQLVDFSYLGYNFSPESRGSILQLGGFNVYGVLAAYAMIIIIHLQSVYPGVTFKVFSLFSFFILLTSQISTLSRGGFLSLIIGLATYSYFRGNLLKYSLGFLSISAILLSLLINNFDLDFTSLFNRYTFYEDATGTGRTVLWSHILSLMDNPFVIIFGNGAGSLDLFISVSENDWYNSFESTHNTYLEFFYQFGIIGLSLFILFLYNTKKRIDQIILYDDQIILKTIFYVMLINMFFDSYFFAFQISALYSLFFSLFREVRYAK